MTTKPKFACRFPGCTKGWEVAGNRARHEILKHGMKNGVVPSAAQAETADNPPPNFGKNIDDCVRPDPTEHVYRAIEELNVREKEITAVLTNYESLRQELQSIQRAKAILLKTASDLERDTGESELHELHATRAQAMALSNA